jgi:hypothetical protein
LLKNLLQSFLDNLCVIQGIEFPQFFSREPANSSKRLDQTLSKRFAVSDIELRRSAGHIIAYSTEQSNSAARSNAAELLSFR